MLRFIDPNEATICVIWTDWAACLSRFMFPACGENPSPGKPLPALTILSLNCQLSSFWENLGLYSPFPQRSRFTNTQKMSPVFVCVCVFTPTKIILLYRYWVEVSVFIQLKVRDNKRRDHLSQQKRLRILLFFNLIDFVFCCSTEQKQSRRFHRDSTEFKNPSYFWWDMNPIAAVPNSVVPEPSLREHMLSRGAEK